MNRRLIQVPATMHRKIDPKILAQLQIQTKKDKKKNEKTLKQEMREAALKIGDILGTISKTKGMLGQIYNIIEAPTYLDVRNLRGF